MLEHVYSRVLKERVLIQIIWIHSIRVMYKKMCLEASQYLLIVLCLQVNIGLLILVIGFSGCLLNCLNKFLLLQWFNRIKIYLIKIVSNYCSNIYPSAKKYSALCDSFWHRLHWRSWRWKCFAHITMCSFRSLYCVYIYICIYKTGSH